MNANERVLAVPSLADLLRGQEAPHVPPIVLFKAGSASPPIFMTHGMGGDAIGIFPLAMRLRVTQPIYGMQARGIDGVEDPHQNIEDMAEYHLASIRWMQPHGPYFLMGYSLGGLVMLEIARRLSGAGEKIALLAMVDSYPHRRHLSFGQHARLSLRLAKQRALTQLHIGGHVNRSSAGEHAQNSGPQPPSVESMTRAMRRVSEYQDRAWRNYRPRFYDGKINFVSAAIPSFVPDDPAAVWGHLARQFDFKTLPGSHHEMLTAQVESLAATLTSYVTQAVR